MKITKKQLREMIKKEMNPNVNRTLGYYEDAINAIEKLIIFAPEYQREEFESILNDIIAFYDEYLR